MKDAMKTMIGRFFGIADVIVTVGEYLDRAEPECYKRYIRSNAVHVIAFNSRRLFKYCDVLFSAMIHVL